MPKIAQTLVRLTTLLDQHPVEEQMQAMAFLHARYPSLAADALSALEERRRGDRERQALSRDMSHAVTGHPPAPLVVTKASSSVSSEEDQVFKKQKLDKAQKLLDKGDFAFLLACPEPFQSAWLCDGEWWISLRDGYPKINAQQQASRYMAWPGSQRKRDHRTALRNWFAKAEAWRESAEMRQAVRR